MTGQSLKQFFDSIETMIETGALKADIPDYIPSNLASYITLRPYQEKALQRYLYYINDCVYLLLRLYLLYSLSGNKL